MLHERASGSSIFPYPHFVLLFALLISTSSALAACPSYLSSVLSQYSMSSVKPVLTSGTVGTQQVKGLKYAVSNYYASTEVSVFEFSDNTTEIQVTGYRVDIDLQAGMSRRFKMDASIHLQGCSIQTLSGLYAGTERDIANQTGSSVTISPQFCKQIMSDPVAYKFAQGKLKKIPGQVTDAFDKLELQGSDLDVAIVKASAAECINNCSYFSSGCKTNFSKPHYSAIPYSGVDNTRRAIVRQWN